MTMLHGTFETKKNDIRVVLDSWLSEALEVMRPAEPKTLHGSRLHETLISIPRHHGLEEQTIYNETCHGVSEGNGPMRQMKPDLTTSETRPTFLITIYDCLCLWASSIFLRLRDSQQRKPQKIENECDSLDLRAEF